MRAVLSELTSLYYPAEPTNFISILPREIFSEVTSVVRENLSSLIRLVAELLALSLLDGEREPLG
jgi:hypothetical protein